MGSKRDVVSAQGNVSAAKTTPIMERLTKRQVGADDSPVEYALKLKAQQEVHYIRFCSNNSWF